MDDDVEVTQDDRDAAFGAYYSCYDSTPNDLWMDALLAGKHDDDPQVQAFASHRIVSVRAAAMSDLIAGDADLYDTPSARITGDKDRENPVEGARHKPAVTQADVELAEEIGQTMASYYEWGRPSDYQLAKESAAMARELIAAQVEREIVAWLRAENGTCDCCARSEGECACGAWDDYKRVALVEIIDAIEQGQYRSAQ